MEDALLFHVPAKTGSNIASTPFTPGQEKVTFDLSGIPGVVFPAGDEGPKHPGRTGTGAIRRLVEGNMTTLDVPKRVKLSELIGRLYTLRCVADYRPSMDVDGRDAREGVSIMNTVFDSF